MSDLGGARRDDAPAHGATALKTFEQASLRLARLRAPGAAGVGDFLAEATETAARALDVDRVGIWLWIDGHRGIRCYDVYQRRGDRHLEGAVLRAADFPAYFRALEEQRSIPASDARRDPQTLELDAAYLAPLGIASMLDVPLYRGGEVVGVVCHESTTPRRWTAEEKAFATSIADRISAALEESARLEAEDRVQAVEAAAIAASRMEVIGQIAAGIAHDFNNELLVISACADVLAAAELPPRARDAALQIAQAATRSARLARELTGLGRDERAPTRVSDVAAVVAEAAPMLRSALGSDYTVAVEVERTAGGVLIDRASIERVVLNLVLNARDATPAGGTIAVTVRATPIETAPAASRPTVVLEVADEGVGMDAATRARIFDAFFTTKPEGKGSGLGMAVVYRIAQRCGGFVHVDSEVGRGTQVRVYLPMVDA